jgi:hypothetical protein
MLKADEAFDPTVSTLSKPGCAASGVRVPAAEPGRWFSSWTAAGPGRRAKGLRMGIVAWYYHTESVEGTVDGGRCNSIFKSQEYSGGYV